MAQAECLILIQVFFWHCCYVDLSSPVRSLVSLGFNFDLTGFSSIMHYLGIYFIPFGVSLQGVFRFSAILLSLLSLHRPLGTTVVPILCFSPEQQRGTGDDWSTLLPFHRTVDIVAVSVIADNSLSLILIFSRAHHSPQRLKFSKMFLSSCFQII